ncbi:MFS transporter [Candidatus Roizmanbacteria bacterium]|nr:MFS transporter [Candidatus Roizmanbacteria bacterium]
MRVYARLGGLSAVLYSVFYAIGHAYWILVVGAILEGLSRSFYSGNNDALLHDTLYEKQQDKEFSDFLGKVTAMSQAALGVSALIGSVFVGWSFALIMWISVLPQIICFFLGFFLYEPKAFEKTSATFTHVKIAFTLFMKNKKLRTISTASMISYAVGEAMFDFQAIFISAVWPIWAIGIGRTVNSALATVSFHFSGKLIKKFGASKLMMMSNAYNRVASILAYGFPTIISPALLSSTGAVYGALTISKSTLLHREFTHEQRATMGSLNSFLGSIGYGLFAFCLGLLADKISPTAALLIGQVPQLITTWLYWKVFQHERKEQAALSVHELT